jgi:hypothetical protein
MLMAAVGMTAFSAAPAKADHNSFSLAIGAQRAGVWVPPVYERRPRTITTAPIYEDVTRQVWHEPVYETRRIPVEIPARTITRKVPRYSDCGEFLGWDFVEEIVEPARTEWRIERVCVREGYYETVTERVCVRPAGTQVIWEEVVVSPGHWESPSRLVIGKHRPVPPHPVRHAGFRFGFGS